MSGELFEQNVWQLVKTAEAVAIGGDSNMRGHYTEIPWSLLADLNDALAPFRPDPEEELIEAMVEHMKPLWSQYPMPGPPHAELARTALQTIKEKGYFNDQR